MLETQNLHVIQLCNSFLENRTISSLPTWHNHTDTDTLYTLLYRHKLHMILRNLSSFDANICINNNISFREKDVSHWEKVYWSECINTVEALSHQKIDYVIVKGISLSSLLYPTPFIRGIGDIDIVVHEQDFNNAFYLLLSLGYRRSDVKNSNEPFLKYGINHHEIKLSKMIENIRVSVEIKKRTSCTDSFKNWWPHTQRKLILNREFACLDDTHELLHMFMNTFTNNEILRIHQNCRLRDYLDVAYATKYVISDWKILLDAAEEMETTHQIAIVLRSVVNLFPSIREEVKPVLARIEKDYCRYTLSPYYFGADHIQHTNYGLVVDRPRADLTYSIFDKEFSMYQSLKSYKAILYSKKNPDYCNRIKLKKNVASNTLQYVYNNSIHAYYHYYSNGNTFYIVVDIDKKSNTVFSKNICNLSILWYDNDINLPIVTSKIHSPQINDLATISWDISALSKVDEQFFSSEEYLEIIHKRTPIQAHIYSQQHNEFTRIVFEFNQDNLFFPLDILLFEVKFNFWIHEDNEYFEVELGGNTDFVECPTE